MHFGCISIYIRQTKGDYLMANYEVRITKHFSGKTYNVDLVSWQGDNGMSSGRAFNVSKTEAKKVANKTASLYSAEINWKE